MDNDITPCLNAFLPALGDFIIQQTDVGAAARALGGLGIASHLVGMVAAQAGNVPRRLYPIEQPFQQSLLGSNCGRWTTECTGSGTDGSLMSCQGAILGTGLDQPGGWFDPQDCLPVLYLEIFTAGSALGGDHQCRFLLKVPA